MPLLTELGIFLRGGGYNDAAPLALKQNHYISQLGWGKRFGVALAQGLGSKPFQLRVSAFFRDDAFPFAVAGLLLEKTRKVHDLTGFVLGQSIHDANQFLGCRTHDERLNRRPIPRNHEHAPATDSNVRGRHKRTGSRTKSFSCRVKE
jgi:hypothetical protein